MTKQDLDQWFNLRNQVVNGYHLSRQDKQELLRLNHLVMEESHLIHNNNMLKNDIEYVGVEEGSLV